MDISEKNIPHSTGTTSVVQGSGKQLGFIALIGIVISAMIGGGIYNLPQNMAESASAGSIILAWLVTGIGVWFIANTFRILSAARPELTNGLYAYAESGFGTFTGFFVAYGYWVCNCFALAAYSVLVTDTLNYFLPYFKGGNNIPSIIVGSGITWLMYFLTLKGAKQTGAMNIVGTIGKIVPAIVFIAASAALFRLPVFMTDFWGAGKGAPLAFSLKNAIPQIKSTMLVTLWLFIGIEGAVVVSGRAKSQELVRRSTVWGYLLTLVLYIAVSLLPLGMYSQPEISGMENPSTAYIMLNLFGTWGEILMNIGVLLSVLSSWLVWMLMLGEMPLAAARNGTFPRVFLRENKYGAAVPALLATTIVTQLILVLSHFAGNAWDTMISITSVMSLPCYLLCTMFLLKIILKKEYPDNIFASKTNAAITALAGFLYGLWLIYAAGLSYMMIACVVYAIGIPLYISAVKPNKGPGPLFKSHERAMMIIVVALGIAGIVYSALKGLH